MVDLSENKNQAFLAVQYTRGVIKNGADNRGERTWDEYLYRKLTDTSPVKVKQTGSATYLRSLAVTAAACGVGNCGEHSAVAFFYLYNKGIFPIDMISAINADHAFVVVGRSEDSDPGSYKTWNSNAAICDAWDSKAFGVEQFEEQMYEGKGMSTKLTARATAPGELYVNVNGEMVRDGIGKKAAAS